VGVSEENVEIAKRIYASINRRDLDEFLAQIDPDVEFTSLIAEAEGQTYRGHDGVREWWDRVVGALEGLQLEPEEIRDFDNRGLIKVRATAEVEGVEVTQTMWQAYHLRDGVPVWWGFFRTEAEALDTTGLRELLTDPETQGLVTWRADGA
jgi:ketosteroid isomerase-like protein